MRRLATWAVVAALLTPMTASAEYTFGDWARDQGFSPGDVMPKNVWSIDSSPAIESLDGIADFDWTTTPTMELYLEFNQISSIAANAFVGMTNLEWLSVRNNPLSSIESSAFSGLANLTTLYLNENQISDIETGTFSGLTSLQWLVLYINNISSIEAGDFSGLTNLTELELGGNQISSIESGDFSELTHLTELNLSDSPLSSIESGVFSGLAGPEGLNLGGNTALTELNLSDADFSRLTHFHVGGNANITSVSLSNSVLNQTALISLLSGTGATDWYIGIGELDDIAALDLSGIDFVNITDLEPLYVMDGLTDLRLVDPTIWTPWAWTNCSTTWRPSKGLTPRACCI